ncbi:CheY-like superfamily [Hyaloraphidium curvatum]|nr:CheY-like superfamily [Hyaloraphidium curvatum]
MKTLENLFHPYSITAAVGASEYSGSGLGLAIADRISRLMGGQVAVERVGSQAGPEAQAPVKLVFRLPIKVVEARPPESAAAATTITALPSPIVLNDVGSSLDSLPTGTTPWPRTSSNVSGASISTLPSASASVQPATRSRRRMLVTDDSQMNRNILVRILNKIISDWRPEPGVEWPVEEAENGQEAVRKVAERVKSVEGGLDEIDVEDRYVVCFMDVIMPVMDGLKATRRITSLTAPEEDGSSGRRHPPVPVIITTANRVTGSPEAEEEWRSVGACDAISKPFGRDKIELLLNAHCFGGARSA